MLKRVFIGIFLYCLSQAVSAEPLRLAVASNFLGPLKAIAGDFQKDTGHTVRISSGSTGKLYAQIVNGAPFDVFLAANSREPQRLEKEARIRPGSRYTYALGVLALWEPKAPLDGGAAAREAFSPKRGQRVALANPRTAPYGTAAQAVLQEWGMLSHLRPQLIRGDNIAQAYQFTATGNARYGFVALSQLLDPRRVPDGRYWQLDSDLYPPIRQQAVILKRAMDKPAALAFMRYLQSATVRERIKAYGYGLE